MSMKERMVKTEKKAALRKEIREWALALLIALAVALFLRLFVFEFTAIELSSMEPTLSPHDYVLVEKVSYRFGAPAYGDVVICRFPGSDDYYVKRVIGTAGDVLEIRDGVLTINGVPDKYFTDYMEGDMPPTTVPEGTVFVMGDNRNISVDSREVGPLTLDMIVGRAVVTVWPPDRIRGL